MINELENGRYQRNFKSITVEEQLILQSKSVAIIGCGGLGGFLAEEFARLGVGRLILVDGDRIEVSNLNRQLFSLEDNLGELKVNAAQQRLQKVNSSIRIDFHAQFFNEETGKSLLQGADLVCDALDHGRTRILLEQTCHDLKIPLVLAAIGGWYGTIAVSYPGDQVAAKIFREDKKTQERRGNPAFSPATIASLAVAESVKILIGRPPSLRHKFLYIDLLSMEFYKFTV